MFCRRWLAQFGRITFWVMNYFAYGSNMSSHEMRGVDNDSKFLAIARLQNHRLDFNLYSENRGGGVADIVPSEGAEVWGVVYTITQHGLTELDKKEGVRKGRYRSVDVEVETDEGELIRCTSYSVIRKGQSIRPSDSYRDLIIYGAKERGLPEDYVNGIDRYARSLDSTLDQGRTN